MRRLSSLTTVFYKWIAPPFWILIVLWAAKNGSLTNGSFFFLVFILVSLIVIYKFGIAIKTIHIDHKNLYVRDYFKTITIPLAEMSGVSSLGVFMQNAIFIRFHSNTEFGDEIMFYPRIDLFSHYKKHPIYYELESKIKPREGE